MPATECDKNVERVTGRAVNVLAVRACASLIEGMTGLRLVPEGEVGMSYFLSSEKVDGISSRYWR